MTTFVTSAIASADFVCYMSYISSDGHFSEVYLDCLVISLKSLLDIMYCRVTTLDKKLNSQVIVCSALKVMQTDNQRVRRRSMAGHQAKQNTGKYEYHTESRNECSITIFIWS